MCPRSAHGLCARVCAPMLGEKEPRRVLLVRIPDGVAHSRRRVSPRLMPLVRRSPDRRSAPTAKLTWSMHKTLHLLGLLLSGPKSGYDLHRILRAHGDLYADLKKGNVYYLLDRLASESYLTVEAESGARGPRGERLLYSMTDRGRAYFEELLCTVLRAPEPSFSGVAAAVIFLDRLPVEEAISLLEERRARTLERRHQVAAHGSSTRSQPLTEIAVDHLLSLIDADLAWTERTLDRVRTDRDSGDAPSTDSTSSFAGADLPASRISSPAPTGGGQ